VTLAEARVVRYDLAPAQDRDGVLGEHVGFACRSIRFTYAGQHEVELEVHGNR
jgi:hypothetical protein